MTKRFSLFLRATLGLLLAFACQKGVEVSAVATATSAGFICQSCVPISPAGGSGPISTGGAKSTGGSRATGGKTATGGANPIAGSPATGGLASTGGTSSCAPIVLPTRANATPEALKMAKHHRFHARHHRRPGRAPATREATSLCSATHLANCSTLDQGETGSCTGNAHVMAISTQPFVGSAHCNETDARTAYAGGTCIDNGCQVPCTCASCKAAFCPATNANDTGSQTGSVAQWLVDVGWLGSFTTADTIATLESCLARGPAVIGIDFYNSMMTPTANGQLQVATASGLAGGHDMNAAILDLTHAVAPVDAVWVHNSWGDSWGWCLGSECGYAWIAVTDLPKLHFDGDCPTPPFSSANDNAFQTLSPTG